MNSNNLKKGCVILYSGGTDSTCTAALMAEKYSTVHLLSFYENNKPSESAIGDTIYSLEKKFSKTKFIHRILSTTKLVKYISFHRFFRYLFFHRWLVLSTPGFTTLSWHVNAIVYCIENNIKVVADGQTRELMHFPGHMDGVIKIFKKLYEEYGIHYINPVRTWDIPPDQQFIDRLIVDQHGYFFPSEDSQAILMRTTGKYLFKLGIMPSPNVKGSTLDHKMQFDCYPFVLYNIMVFWIYLNFKPYEYLCKKMEFLFEEKVSDVKLLLDEYIIKSDKSKLSDLLDKA